MAASSNQNLGCLFSFLRLLGLGGVSSTPTLLPYRQREDFLSTTELSFYRVLLQVIDGRAVVCPKVRVADLLFVIGNEGRTAAQNRINAKHVDFVLCRPSDLRPLLVVELDDRSHQRPDRAQRDDFLDQVFAAADLKLLHLPARRSYQVAELATLIAPHLSPSTAPTPVAPKINISASNPTCPKCGSPMVLRTASRGDKAGQNFYGCPNFPRCRETVAIRS